VLEAQAVAVATSFCGSKLSLTRSKAVLTSQQEERKRNMGRWRRVWDWGGTLDGDGLEVAGRGMAACINLLSAMVEMEQRSQKNPMAAVEEMDAHHLPLSRGRLP
jgi:hypothetical protein